MVMRRYLVFFSYTGTYFSGLQRQRSRSAIYNEDPSTVQGLMEYAVSRLKPQNNVIMHLSSRTDQGVHALKNSCIIDLDFENEIKPSQMVYHLNKFFCKTDLDIRIQEIIRVNSDFRVRGNVLWRKYLYKFAVLKPDVLAERNPKEYYLPIPATEVRRCYYVPQDNFQIDRVRDVLDMFIGSKDFLTFQSKSKNPAELSTIKDVLTIDLEPSTSYVPSTYDYFDHWDISIRGRSFLYKMVRRMVAVLLEAGFGRLDRSTVQNMFDCPSSDSWPNNVLIAPAHGLYLVEVKYDPCSLICSEIETEKLAEKQLAEDENGDDAATKLEKRKEAIKERLQRLQLLKKLKMEN